MSYGGFSGILTVRKLLQRLKIQIVTLVGAKAYTEINKKFIKKI